MAHFLWELLPFNPCVLFPPSFFNLHLKFNITINKFHIVLSVYCLLGRKECSKATMARLALQNWGTSCIRCPHELWAALEKGHKVDRVWTKVEEDDTLEWWCFDKNWPHLMDTQSSLCSRWCCYIRSKGWSVIMGFQGGWPRKLACSGHTTQLSDCKKHHQLFDSVIFMYWISLGFLYFSSFFVPSTQHQWEDFP